MLDLASDLLFFCVWGGASWLDRDLDWGYQAVHCAGSTVWLLCMWVTNEV